MTNKEAINEIEMTISLINQDGKDWVDERDIPWLSMAFEALSKEPCEDCASRQGAIDAPTESNLKNHMDSVEGGQENCVDEEFIRLAEAIDEEIMDSYYKIRSIIKSLPSAQPERKKGKWIRITQGAIPEQYICPFCHRTVEAYDVEELLSIRYPYCHCGADMRGEE